VKPVENMCHQLSCLHVVHYHLLVLIDRLCSYRYKIDNTVNAPKIALTCSPG